MGLRRNQETDAREGEKFDMRGTVEDFKRAVWAYGFWNPTMLIHVRHIRRKDLPDFVFPGGIRPSQPVKVANVGRLKRRRLESSQVNVDEPEKKRKQNEVAAGIGLNEPVCISLGNNFADFQGDFMAEQQGESDAVDSLTNSNYQKISYNHQEAEASVRNCQPSATLCSGSSPSCAASAENIAIKHSSELSISRQDASKVVDELEDDRGFVDQVQHFGATKSIPMQSSAKNDASATDASSTETKDSRATSYKLFQDGISEELEVRPLSIFLRLSFSRYSIFILLSIYLLRV